MSVFGKTLGNRWWRRLLWLCDAGLFLNKYSAFAVVVRVDYFIVN
jgi:hypothetical protein